MKLVIFLLAVIALGMALCLPQEPLELTQQVVEDRAAEHASLERHRCHHRPLTCQER